jgi:hypothetical protein
LESRESIVLLKKNLDLQDNGIPSLNLSNWIGTTPYQLLLVMVDSTQKRILLAAG